jgi:cobalamin biosynthesis Mg chelatase CobN
MAIWMNRARLSWGLAPALLATLLGAAVVALGAPAARAATSSAAHTPTFPIPASARVHGTGSAVTSTPATAARGTAGAAGTPTTPAGGTGAPATGAPGTAAPGATATPGATTTPGAAGGTPGATTTPGTAPATTVPTPSTAGSRAATTQHTRAGSKRLSTGAIIAAVLATLLIVACLAWGAARWFAYEPRWIVSLRHSLAEAGWRLSASWDEFSDWARIGR